MFYKKIVIWWLVFVSIFMMGTWLCSIVIDPIGIWTLTSIQGLNHYKSKQSNYLDVWKPYQYYKARPDIVYIGSSRVYVGLSTEGSGDYTKNMYNMGGSSLSIKDMREYIKFMYGIHKPKDIYIGLDFFQFGKENYYMQRSGFSEERLKNLQKSGVKRFFYQSAESFTFAKYIPVTIYESWQNKNEYTFLAGWDKPRGTALNTDERAYYGYLNTFMNVYENWVYEPKAMEDLKEIVEEAKKENVNIHLFFNPLNVDLYALLDVTDKLNEFNKIKFQVAQIDTVFDFAFVNAMTTNRDLFYDVSHYKKAIGEKMKSMMNGSNQNFILFQADAKNVLDQLNREKTFYDKWKKENKLFYDVLKKHYLDKSQFQQGELKQFIGW